MSQKYLLTKFLLDLDLPYIQSEIGGDEVDNQKVENEPSDSFQVSIIMLKIL